MEYANKVIQFLFTFKEANLKLSLRVTRHKLAHHLLLSFLNSTQIIAVFPIAIKTIKLIVTRPRIWSQTKGQRH